MNDKQLATLAAKNGNYLLDAPSIDSDQLRSNMAWSFPKYSRNQVDSAGDCLRKSQGDLETARAIAADWRVAHSLPLHVASKKLEAIARSIDPSAIVASRHKRMESIEAKLKRFTNRLSKVQDIAGCRAIFKTVEDVRKAEILMQSSFGECASRPNDYILNPKSDGYRGVHRVQTYQCQGKECDGMLVEIQLRTELQHAWATAVETVDVFTGQNLKSGIGDPNWKRFFALAGSFFAILEHSPLVPGTPDDPLALCDEMKEMEQIALVKNFVIFQQLSGKGHLSSTAEPGSEKTLFFILDSCLDKNNGTVIVTSFPEHRLAEANSKFVALEKEIIAGRKANVVLVSGSATASIREAYPNYFADTSKFAIYMNLFRGGS